MLEEPVKSILFYLNGKAKEKFSGGIKMGFEDGRPASFTESDKPDKEIPERKPDFDLAENIKKACTGRFYGTLFCVYDKGEITHFYSHRTWQGRVLEAMLEGAPIKPRQKPQFTVVVKR